MVLSRTHLLCFPMVAPTSAARLAGQAHPVAAGRRELVGTARWSPARRVRHGTNQDLDKIPDFVASTLAGSTKIRDFVWIMTGIVVVRRWGGYLYANGGRSPPGSSGRGLDRWVLCLSVARNCPSRGNFSTQSQCDTVLLTSIKEIYGRRP
ncbi:hypothetical protein Pflav_030580 [Phytohabitans flavus]|uniref:Uncharacterized protein n=1 Tax=Phytohabitans flavus TaxID=1076124 RepID=A0A6F8XSC0_9ACTN|nr:hypothetical protein Pflav_030580 [Phytohabitans flavus]